MLSSMRDSGGSFSEGVWEEEKMRNLPTPQRDRGGRNLWGKGEARQATSAPCGPEGRGVGVGGRPLRRPGWCSSFQLPETQFLPVRLPSSSPGTARGRAQAVQSSCTFSQKAAFYTDAGAATPPPSGGRTRPSMSHISQQPSPPHTLHEFSPRLPYKG